MNDENSNLDLCEPRQNILLNDYSFIYKSDYKEFYHKCRVIQQFCEIAPNQKYVVQTLFGKINNNVHDKKIIYQYIINLFFFTQAFSILTQILKKS